ncbi:MAG TPA: hypothetical protein VIQ53_20745, partial [Inquilinus sp.]
HLLWFPAPWPETYSYVLSAGIASGRPIVAGDIGAFPERLEGRPWTWIVPPKVEAGVWIEAFKSVREALLAARSPTPGQPRSVDESFFYPDTYLAPALAHRPDSVLAMPESAGSRSGNAAAASTMGAKQIASL